MNNIPKNILDYDLYIFDCDGVILDSNNLKAEAFYSSVLEFGEEKSAMFLKYHNENGGVSRYKKFDYFFTNIHNNKDIDLISYIEKYAKLISIGYLETEITDGFFEFIEKVYSKECYVVSASEEKELIEVFKYKKIDRYFKSIYGSPKSKIENIDNNIDFLNKKVLFIGDSASDLEASKYFNFDFLFLSAYCKVNLDVKYKVQKFKDLI